MSTAKSNYTLEYIEAAKKLELKELFLDNLYSEAVKNISDELEVGSDESPFYVEKYMEDSTTKLIINYAYGNGNKDIYATYPCKLTVISADLGKGNKISLHITDISETQGPTRKNSIATYINGENQSFSPKFGYIGFSLVNWYKAVKAIRKEYQSITK